MGEPAFERRVKNGAKFGGCGGGVWEGGLGSVVGLGGEVELVRAFGAAGSSDGMMFAGMGVVVSGWVKGRRDDGGGGGGGGGAGEDDAGSVG